MLCPICSIENNASATACAKCGELLKDARNKACDVENEYFRKNKVRVTSKVVSTEGGLIIPILNVEKTFEVRGLEFKKLVFLIGWVALAPLYLLYQKIKLNLTNEYLQGISGKYGVKFGDLSYIDHTSEVWVTFICILIIYFVWRYGRNKIVVTSNSKNYCVMSSARADAETFMRLTTSLEKAIEESKGSCSECGEKSAGSKLRCSRCDAIKNSATARDGDPDVLIEPLKIESDLSRFEHAKHSECPHCGRVGLKGVTGLRPKGRFLAWLMLFQGVLTIFFTSQIILTILAFAVSGLLFKLTQLHCAECGNDFLETLVGIRLKRTK